jgi:enoyl-CoA hydratase
VREILPFSTDDCVVEREGPIVVMTMRRPEKRNAMSPRMMVALADAYTYIDEHADVRCGVLTGADGNFTTGMDLTAEPPGAEEARRRLEADPGLVWKGLLRDYRCSKPIVAAVEGYAVAGGTELLQGTDVRVAGESAVFGVWEAKRGIYPQGGSACRLPRQIPYTVAMDIMLTARPVPASEALAIGLVSRVVPDGQALPTAMDIARQIAANGPLAVQLILRMWRETEGMADAEAMAYQHPFGVALFETEDVEEGRRAFAEKRTPRFEGR